MSILGELEGDLEGDLEGELEGDLEGDLEGSVVGIVRRNPRTGRATVQRVKQRNARTVTLAPKPQWRKNQWGPGVAAPKDDRLILPMTPLQNGGLFTAAVGNVIYQGEPQKPFRGQRLLVSVVRTGASATGRLMGQLFAGTDLQQGDIGAFDVELVGQANSFDTYLTTSPVEPGVKIRLQVNISANPAGADTVFLTMTFLGNLVH